MTKLSTIKMLTIASLSAIALTASIALAQTGSTQTQPQNGQRHGHEKAWGGGEGRGEGGGGRMHGMMFRGLNLTDDQKAKMKQLSQSFHDSTKSTREALQAKRQELRQANDGGTFNEALAAQKLQESAGLEAKLMGEQFKLRQAMLSILTPEQKAQMDQKRAEFKAKRAERGQSKNE